MRDAWKRQRGLVRADLAKAGLVEHTAKSNWVPTQQTSWLGSNLDLKVGLVFILEEKIVALKSQLQRVCHSDSVKARVLASMIGKIISMSLALGPVTRLMTKNLYADLNTWEFWCQMLPISAEFWLNHVDSLNGRRIWQGSSAVRVVYTDASNSEYGGHTVEHGCHVAHGLWSVAEANQSSTWQELRAVRMMLESLVGKLQNYRVRWFTDNQKMVWILMTGSRKPPLQKEALAIYSFAVSNAVHIKPDWVPRGENQVADFLSRLTDTDDWSIHQEVFKQLNTL